MSKLDQAIEPTLESIKEIIKEQHEKLKKHNETHPSTDTTKTDKWSPKLGEDFPEYNKPEKDDLPFW